MISTVSLGWSIANNDHVDMKIYSLRLFFALYVFVISARSVHQVTTDDHSDSILHLTVLLTVAFSLLGSAAILPDSPPPTAASINDEPGIMKTLVQSTESSREMDDKEKVISEKGEETILAEELDPPTETSSIVASQLQYP